MHKTFTKFGRIYKHEGIPPVVRVLSHRDGNTFIATGPRPDDANFPVEASKLHHAGLKEVQQFAEQMPVYGV